MLQNRIKTAYGIYALYAIIFVVIASKGITTYQPGDENVYYYMGQLVAEGKLPYQDFFYAHPPLHIYLLSLIYVIFGFNIIIFKSVPLILNLATSFFIFKLAKEKFGDYEALLSSLLFLFSYSIMFNSIFSFGIELASVLLVIGIYLSLIKKNYILSGIFFGLASIARLLSLVPIGIILVVVLFSNKKNFLKLLSAFLFVFLLVNGVFFMLLGNIYIEDVYKYHLLKSYDSRENLSEYLDIIKLNWILFFSALLFIFLKYKKPIRLFAIISVAYLTLLFFLKNIFGFYFMIAFPFLAVMGGYSIINIIRMFNLKKKLVIALSFALILAFLWNLTADILFLYRIGFVGFERGNDIADFININSRTNTLIFGDDSVAPLLALLTGKKIANDFVDTNNQVFISGVRNLNDTLKDLKGRDVLFIIRDRQGISYFNEVKSFLNNNCGFLSRFYDKIEGGYLIYRCS